ncbi:MAG: oligoendopeptidase F [Victivallales bacterium]|nr:oligoendopeptidase F [Victivallales bacterium]
MMTTPQTLPLHSELPVEMTWDIEVIYPDQTAWENDFTAIGDYLAAAVAFRGRLGEGPAVLAEAFRAGDRLNRLVEKLYTYAHLRSDEDTSISAHRALVDRASARYAEISGALSWFEPELLALPKARLKEYLAAPELQFYLRTLTEILRDQPHTLSDKEERLLGLASDVFASSARIFSQFNNADLKFPVIADEQGREKELTHGNYLNFMESPAREVRHRAFNAMYDTYAQYRNTLATTLFGEIKTHTLTAQLRHYPSALAASLHEDNVPVAVYDNLIVAVRRHLPALFRYFKLRAKALQLDRIDMFDLYNPLVPECRVEVSWEEACRWVREALRPLGEEYGAKLDLAFSRRWIDVLECRGKRSGAYSGGCYDTNPYVLLNFTGTLNDAFTLAHELGHSLHSYHSREAQDYHYADYRIFVAEVASTTNEMLLHHYLLDRCTDRNLRLYLLNHHCDQFRGTIYRQTMFAEFEKLLHALVEADTPLTADLLCREYFALNAQYHGDAVAPDRRIAMEWARIPHFYYDFYVYKYATGLAAAAQLSRNILSGAPDKLTAYLEFLKAGDTKDVLDIMKDAGVNLATPAPIDAALADFSATVDQLAAELG